MKLLKKIRKGFTLIELVVVIAVIAILAAVSVVSYVSITNNAKKSKDQQLVDQVNLSLQAAEISKAPATMHEALEIVEEDGYKPANFKAEYKEHEFAYNISKNRFVLLKGEAVTYPKDMGPENGNWEIWRFAEKASEFKTGFSHYLREGFADESISVTGGVDVGKNAGITSIAYSTDAAQDVVIRTDSPYTTLKVIAGNATVKHYGNANTINITSVDKDHSYHEFGSVAAINVKEGKIEVEKDAYVGKIAIDEDATASTVKVNVNGGTVFDVEVIEYDASSYNHTASSESNPVATQAETKVTPSDSVLKVGTAAALINLANAQSQGMISYLKIELTADIDLTGKTWIPFGQNQSHSFEGTIDGKYYSIIGLNGIGATATEQFVSTTAQVAGNAYGLIAYARGSVTIKNLTMKDVEINLTGSGNGVGALIGVATYKESNTEKMLFDNVKVYGNISSTDKVGGFVGTTKHTSVMPGTMYDNILLEFNNCENHANVSAENTTSARAGGFIGAAYNEKFTKCKNYGNVSATGNIANDSSVGAGVLVGCFNFGSGNLNYNQLIISGCTNSGSVSATNNHASTKPTVSGCKDKSWLLNQPSVNWPGVTDVSVFNQTFFNENESEMTTFTLSGNGNK